MIGSFLFGTLLGFLALGTVAAAAVAVEELRQGHVKQAIVAAAASGFLAGFCGLLVAVAEDKGLFIIGALVSIAATIIFVAIESDEGGRS